MAAACARDTEDRRGMLVTAAPLIDIAISWNDLWRHQAIVAVVEFGPRVRARAVTAGGESGHPQSPHFNDQAQRYASGALREVYFHPDQLKGHTERVYRPGE